MSKILTIGSICLDIFFPTDEGAVIETPNELLSQKKIAFELGAKFAVARRYESMGGNSVNVAVGLAGLGEDVSAYTTIGSDSAGQWIMSQLEKTGVGIECVKKENDCMSDLSAIVVDDKSGERIIFSSHGANEKMVFSGENIESPHWFFIGDLSGDWQNNIDRIIDVARIKKSLIAFNPRQKTIHDDVKKIFETVSKCELLFVNKDEAIEIVAGCGDITVKELLENEEYLVKVLHRIGAKTVALTDGLRGAWGYDGRQLLHAGAVPQKALDSTGAGDAFTSGFLAAHIKRNDLQTCLKWGIANSSNSVTEFGGQAGLLDEKEIIEMAKKVQVKILN